ncbi:MAG: hypothetical protein CL847_07365 [Crocinitomicaceae bacterium]|nr:hypothetical protein [Crocinitomicaceae bacterium]
MQESTKIVRKTMQNIDVERFKPATKMFSNQIKFGRKITERFLDTSKFIVQAIAPTQSGKTGSISACIMFMNKHPQIKLPPENVFILSGLSSKDWVQQTKERFPKSMENQIYHRNKFKRFVKDVKMKKNVLVVIDEVQLACLPGQALHSAFIQSELMNLQYIMENDIKILLISATPDGVVYDLNDWKQGACVEFMDVPESYISIHHLMDENRIFQYKELCGAVLEKREDETQKQDSDDDDDESNEQIYENIREIEKYLTSEPKIHIIRTRNSIFHTKTIKNFKKVFKGKDYLFLSETKINMYKLLEKSPEKHTFIFIKEKLRCAQTIPKEYLGVLYERATESINDSVVIQGLAGRLTGYHENKTSVVFTNVNSIMKYKELLDNNFKIEEPQDDHGYDDEEDSGIMWISNSTKAKYPYTKGTYLCVDKSKLYKKMIKIGHIEE